MNTLKDKELLELDRQFVWHPYTQEKIYHEKRPPLVIRKAKGFFLEDSEGKQYYDGNGSWWLNGFGHSHPELLEVLNNQAATLAHVAMAGLIHEPAVLLAQALVKSAPKGISRVFFSDNGSTAVEVAMKMAFHRAQIKGEKNRTRFLSLSSAFHGETLGAVAVGGVKSFHQIYGPLLTQVVHLASPAGKKIQTAWPELEKQIRQQSPTACAVIVESMVQGAGGMAFYEPEFLIRLRKLCDECGLLLICDEVFTGVGRSGKFWAVEHAGIRPDFMCSSKVLTGGFLPFAVTLSTEEIYQSFYGEKGATFYYGHSYTGNPLGCALALKSIELTYRELPTLAARAEIFKKAMERFYELQSVVEVRTLGFIGAVELAGNGYEDDIGWRIYDEALKEGLYARPLGNVLYLLPMLNMDEAHLNNMVDRLYKAARRVLGTRKS